LNYLETMTVPNNRTLDILKAADEGGCKSVPLRFLRLADDVDGVIAQTWYADI
jgi:hypothetical protein